MDSYTQKCYLKKGVKWTKLLKANEVFDLKNLIDYEDGSIAYMDLASNEGMKFMILSFDDGCMLSGHRAPGDALFFALEGKATIIYEGKSYNIREGENFRFKKMVFIVLRQKGNFKLVSYTPINWLDFD